MFFFLQLLSETFLILKGIQQDIIINVHKSSCNVPLFLSDCNWSWIFFTDFQKTLKYQISWKLSSRSRTVHCGWMDRQT